MKRSLSILSLAFITIFTISCSEEEDPKVEDPIEEETIEIFTDLAFSNTEDSEDFGLYFSLSAGKVYKESELEDIDVSTIDLVYGTLGTPVNYFESPAKVDAIENGRSTATVNYVTNEFDAEKFADMEDDSLIKDLVIEYDNESFPASYRGVVLFQTEDGRKGIIKVTDYSEERILVDIKVQVK